MRSLRYVIALLIGVYSTAVMAQESADIFERIDSLNESYSARLDSITARLNEILACHSQGLVFNGMSCRNAIEVDPHVADFARTDIGLPTCGGDELLKSASAHDIACLPAATYVDASVDACGAVSRQLSVSGHRCQVALPLLGEGSTQWVACFVESGGRSYQLSGTYRCGANQTWSTQATGTEIVQTNYLACRAPHSLGHCIATFTGDIGHGTSKQLSCTGSDGTYYTGTGQCQDVGNQAVLTVTNVLADPVCASVSKKLTHPQNPGLSCVAGPLPAGSGATPAQLIQCDLATGDTLKQQFICDVARGSYQPDPARPDVIVTTAETNPCEGSVNESGVCTQPNGCLVGWGQSKYSSDLCFDLTRTSAYGQTSCPTTRTLSPGGRCTIFQKKDSTTPFCLGGSLSRTGECRMQNGCPFGWEQSVYSPHLCFDIGRTSAYGQTSCPSNRTLSPGGRCTVFQYKHESGPHCVGGALTSQAQCLMSGDCMSGWRDSEYPGLCYDPARTSGYGQTVCPAHRTLSPGGRCTVYHRKGFPSGYCTGGMVLTDGSCAPMPAPQ